MMSYKFSPEQCNFQLRHQLKNSRYVGSELFQDTTITNLSNNRSRVFSGSAWTYVTVPSTGRVMQGEDDDIIACLDDFSGFLVVSRRTLTARLDNLGMAPQGSNAYRGVVRGLDNRFYGIPYNSTSILIIDPTTKLASTTTMGVNLSGSDKWDSGALGPDGKIYCAPINATDVLIIDTINQSATRSTLGLNWTGTFKRYSSATVGNQIWFGPGASSTFSSSPGNDITRLTFTYMGDNINPPLWHTGLINLG